MAEQLKDAVVTIPTPIANSAFGKDYTPAGDVLIRNITGWRTAEGFLRIYRNDTEVATFKDWVGVRAKAID